MTVAQMNNSSACGADGLCVRFVKLCMPYICHVITHIVNSSLASHTVPASWKLTYIHPIQKTAKSTETSNYRPISILPTIAKITERVVYEQLFEYFTSHHLFPSYQGSFPSRSVSIVNLMSSRMPFILSRNSARASSPCCHRTHVSSTYRRYMTGFSGLDARSFLQVLP